jgi:hypothetical protein
MPSVSRNPGGHESIALSNSTPTVSQRSRKMRSGFFQNIFCIDNWRHRAGVVVGRGSFAHKIEDFLLLNVTEIFQFRFRILFDVGKNHFARVADEKTIRKIDKPFPIDLRQQMMRHLFLKKDTLVGRHRAGQLFNNLPPDGFAVCDDFFGTRVFFAGPR